MNQQTTAHSSETRMHSQPNFVDDPQAFLKEKAASFAQSGRNSDAKEKSSAPIRYKVSWKYD